MSTGKDEYVSVDSPNTADNDVGAVTDLFRTSTTRAPVPEESPGRANRLDLVQAQTFVFIVIRFDEIRIGFSYGNRIRLTNKFSPHAVDDW
jgi:hypothetical protein